MPHFPGFGWYGGLFEVAFEISVWLFLFAVSVMTCRHYDMGLGARKPVFGGWGTTKVQICLRIRAYVLGAQNYCLNEMVLLSTHNICFG